MHRGAGGCARMAAGTRRRCEAPPTPRRRWSPRVTSGTARARLEIHTAAGWGAHGCSVGYIRLQCGDWMRLQRWMRRVLDRA